MSDLVGNPEDRFSQNEAQMVYTRTILDIATAMLIPSLNGLNTLVIVKAFTKSPEKSARDKQP